MILISHLKSKREGEFMSTDNILELLLNGSPVEKRNILSHLSDVFESYNNDIADFDKIMNSLIALSVKENTAEMRDEILGTLIIGMTKNIDNISFDIIGNNIEQFPVSCIPRCIELLSYTYNRKYVPAIMKFEDHEDENVKEAVADAIQELGHM